jgi:hypothetical protein
MWRKKNRRHLFSFICTFCKMDRYISGVEVKKAFSVSSCAFKRWADEGRVKATRTAGGRDFAQRVAYHLFWGKRVQLGRRFATRGYRVRSRKMISIDKLVICRSYILAILLLPMWAMP